MSCLSLHPAARHPPLHCKSVIDLRLCDSTGHGGLSLCPRGARWRMTGDGSACEHKLAQGGLCGMLIRPCVGTSCLGRRVPAASQNDNDAHSHNSHTPTESQGHLWPFQSAGPFNVLDNVRGLIMYREWYIRTNMVLYVYNIQSRRVYSWHTI